MVKKLIIIIVIIVLVTLVIGGCWSRKEPKELAIITSVIYDIDGEQYSVYIEMLDPLSAANGASQGKPNKIVRGNGQTVPESIRNISTKIDRIPYGGNNRARFFTEKFAEKGLKTTIDFYLRDHLADERPYMLMLKGDVDPLMLYDAEIGLAELVGVYIDSLAKTTMEASGFSVFNKSLMFMKDYYNEGKQPVMGIVELVPNEAMPPSEGNGSDSSSSVKKLAMNFEGMAVFKEDKFLGYLDKYDTRAYNFIVNEIKRPYISAPYGDKYIVGNIIKSKCDIKTKWENNEAQIDISIKTSLMVVQDEAEIDSGDITKVKVAEEAFNEFFKEEIATAVSRVQTDYASDIFGFGCHFHRQNPKVWKGIKQDWDEVYFPNAKINVNVESKVELEGEIEEPFGWRVKE